MRIVRQGRVPAKKEYRVDCDNCDTVFIFEEGEARYVSDQRDGDYRNQVPDLQGTRHLARG